jgi:hypothetical protein
MLERELPTAQSSVNISLPVQRSELSGKPIDGEAASEVELLLPDGRRTRLLVQAAEADDLASKGRPVPSAVAWIPRGGRRFLWGVVKWVGYAVIGVLVVQALGKQVADRQKELELKGSLTSDLGSSSFEAFAEARSLAYRPRHARSRARRLEIQTAWISDEGRLDGLIGSYLPTRNHAAGRQWGRFRDGFYAWLSLACCQRQDLRIERLQEVETYLRANGATDAFSPNVAYKWAILRCGNSCAGYADAFDWLGREVLGLGPVHEIRKSAPEGFSSGFGDFLHDAFPVY